MRDRPSQRRPRLLVVVGARPSYVKAAPVHRAAIASGTFVSHGTNRLVGSRPDRARAAAERALAKPRPAAPKQPPLWDGHAADRIVETLLSRFAR